MTVCLTTQLVSLDGTTAEARDKIWQALAAVGINCTFGGDSKRLDFYLDDVEVDTTQQ